MPCRQTLTHCRRYFLFRHFRWRRHFLFLSQKHVTHRQICVDKMLFNVICRRSPVDMVRSYLTRFDTPKCRTIIFRQISKHLYVDSLQSSGMDFKTNYQIMQNKADWVCNLKWTGVCNMKIVKWTAYKHVQY